ncbi:hypothetical protein F441_03713 [Phytophthora nicotianae CJ01A1]|uniref:Uncharacterized protein n=2 Tax=Phytophthora nicotianae TaxID=4792 RepID=W2XKT6_PHYNI|nr:hypothetical protein F444_12598 [Phytophthora nicotianae P1976]ETP23097.1 hypothetical protein F441_03713 [Phytophthora nicotianae CJ01A1]
MTECYAKPLALFTLCETQWNSMQSCLRLFFKFEAHSKYRGYRDFPSSLAVFSDLAFWRKLAEAEALIAPLPEASYRLQRDENTMADVVVSFRDIFVGFNGVLASYRCELVNGVESRWGQCEQPLFVLAFLLNPAAADDCRKLIEETDHKKRVLEVEERLVQGRLPVDEQADISEEQQRIQDVKDAAKLVHRHNSQNFPFTAIADSLEMISIVFEAIGSNGLKTR